MGFWFWLKLTTEYTEYTEPNPVRQAVDAEVGLRSRRDGRKEAQKKEAKKVGDEGLTV